MNDKEYILFELVEAGNTLNIEAFLSKNPDLKTAADDYSLLLKGFKGLHLEELEKRLSPSSTSFELEFDKGVKAIQIDQLTQTLQAHANQESVSRTIRVVPLRRRIVSIAAVILVLISSGIWYISSFNQNDLIDDYGQIGVGLNVRDNSTASQSNKVFELLNNEKWSEVIETYESGGDTFEASIQFYYGYALMQEGRFKEAIENFDNVIRQDLVQWSDLAKFNKMLALYMTGNESYESILDKFTSNQNHPLNKVAQEVAAEIKN